MEKRMEYQAPTVQVIELSDVDVILLSWSDESLNLDNSSGQWSTDW